MFSFLTQPALKQHVYNTFDGVPCPMYYREGTSDWNTLMAALEQDEYHLQRFELKPGHTAIDIGSHIGGISLLLATMGLRVFSVEALPENAALQKRNLKLNKRGRQVTLINKAIAASAGGRTRLFYGDTSEEQGKHHEFIGTSEGFKHFFGKGRSVDVPTISIDEIFRQYGIIRCRLLKIDVEGAEWQALESVSDASLDRIDILLGEWHVSGRNKSRADLLNLLRGKFIDVSERFGAPVNDFVFLNARASA